MIEAATVVMAVLNVVFAFGSWRLHRAAARAVAFAEKRLEIEQKCSRAYHAQLLDAGIRPANPLGEDWEEQVLV